MSRAREARGGTARLLAQAEQLLEQRHLDHQHALALWNSLNKRLRLLEHVAEGASTAALMQQLSLHALSVPGSPRTPVPDGMEPSCNWVPVDLLPTSHAGYSMELAQRVACMTVGDAVLMYKSFLARRACMDGGRDACVESHRVPTAR